MRRTVKKQFWMSEAEATELSVKAELCGLSEAALVRTLLAGYHPREKPGPEFYQAMQELNAIRNNINQLIARAHKLRFVDAPMLVREMEKLNQLQLKIERRFLLPEVSDLWQ